MLRLRHVRVDYDDQPVVADVDLEVADGEVLAVLGPSGCGKSTLLRAVAGLEPLAAGSVSWDGVDQARTPAHERGFVLMFQDGQLFDHLDVAANVEYALRRRGSSRTEARPRVAELLEFVGLDGEDHRMPRTLSGGERQRVALARSLAAEPRLLLLDEPLTALDAALRARLAGDLRRILADATALLVTHDQAEAYALADRVAVMREGRVVQQGTVEEVWSAPADAETALFLGYSRVLEGDAARVLLDAAGGLDRLDQRDPVIDQRDPVVERRGPVVERRDPVVEPVETRVAVRRSAVTAAPGPGAAGLSGEVLSVRPTPDEVHLLVRCDGLGEVEATGEPTWVPAVGDVVGLRVNPDRIAVLPPTGASRRPGPA